MKEDQNSDREKAQRLLWAIEGFVDRYEKIENDLNHFVIGIKKNLCLDIILPNDEARWVQIDKQYFTQHPVRLPNRTIEIKNNTQLLKTFFLNIYLIYVVKYFQDARFLLYQKSGISNPSDVEQIITEACQYAQVVNFELYKTEVVLKSTTDFTNKMKAIRLYKKERKSLMIKTAFLATTIDKLGLRKLAGLDVQSEPEREFEFLTGQVKYKGRDLKINGPVKRELFQKLYANIGQVVSKEDLLGIAAKAVGYISELNRLLKSKKIPYRIRTIIREGYKLERS